MWHTRQNRFILRAGRGAYREAQMATLRRMCGRVGRSDALRELPAMALAVGEFVGGVVFGAMMLPVVGYAIVRGR